MRNIKLIIEYDGTKYKGWQRQNNAITIQQCIEDAISEITKENITIIGSSRTDAGVHAKGMVANFYTTSKIPSERFREAINTKLPDDIGIIKSEEVQEEFHSRYSSRGKTYSYLIINRYEKVAMYKDYSLHIKDILNIDIMNEAASKFIGTNDFSAFMSSGSSIKNTVRTIKELKVERYGDNIKIIVTADGFLYNMVRIIVGTLIEVGKGKILPSDISKIIESKDRKMAGPCVLPNGLVLEKVYY